jgi:hypothetical protein
LLGPEHAPAGDVTNRRNPVLRSIGKLEIHCELALNRKFLNGKNRFVFLQVNDCQV